MARALGIILIVGGVVIGLIITGLMLLYQHEGQLTTRAATIGIVVGFIVAVLPQLGIGIYMIWKEWSDTKD